MTENLANPDLSSRVLGPAVQQNISLEQFLHRYGSEKRRKMVEPVYRDMLGEARELIRPLSLYRVFEASDVPQFADFLPGARSVMLGICSIGTRLDERVEALSEGKLAYAVVLDEIGTAMVLELGNQMYQHVRMWAHGIGWRTSPSYRPGIGRWPLELQHDIYRALHAGGFDLRMGESLQILPQKTVSMIVGIGPDLKVRRVPVQLYRGSPN